jgi:hypothetical protein
MNLKKWTGTLPIITLILAACVHPISGVTVLPSNQTSAATELPTSVNTLEIVSRPIVTPTPITSWYSHPQTDTNILGSAYGFLKISKAQIYDTINDAVNATEKFHLAPEPPAYLSYDQTQSVNGKTFVHLTDGGWMPEATLEPVPLTAFSGLIISKPPTQSFGWVIRDTTGWTDASAKSSSGLAHKRYEVVSVISQLDGFALLASNDWVPLGDLALIDLDKLAIDSSSSCRRVDVDLTSQTLVVIENCQLVFATLISSAKAPAKTPEGTFTIFYKEERLPLFANERVASSESFYLADVPWLMFFHENWAIHGAYWHDHFGEPWSHGCINVSPYDALWLYKWSKLGDMIVIHE